MNKANYFYLNILRAEFEKRSSNKSYSLRAFARDLKMTPSVLSEVLNGKKGLGQKTATRLARFLKLSAVDREYFVASTILSRTKSAKLKSQIENKIKILQRKPKVLAISHEDLKMANSWIHTAIIQYMLFDDFDGTPEWLSQKIGLSLRDVQTHLNHLIQINWVANQNNKYTAILSSGETSDDTPAISVKDYHKSVLRLAQDIVMQQSVSLREFQSVSLSFNNEEIVEAKEMIRNFVDDFNARFCAEETKNSVYQLSIQFFDLKVQSK